MQVKYLGVEQAIQGNPIAAGPYQVSGHLNGDVLVAEQFTMT